MSLREIIESFYRTWSEGDIEGALDFCTDDVIAVNVPIGSIEGKAAVREFLRKFGAGMSEVRYEVHHLLENGDTVLLEGQENYTKNGKRVALPYMTAFEFQGPLIKEWRDYFDYATLERQLA